MRLSLKGISLSILFLGFLAFSPLQSLAQMGSGDKAFALENYYLAIDSYKKAIKSKEKNPLTVPVIVVPNPQAVKTNIGSSVGVSATGQKVPKNRMIPKTVFRKGIDD
jgi:hypothetical protein